jgi:hypothetical protein
VARQGELIAQMLLVHTAIAGFLDGEDVADDL